VSQTFTIHNDGTGLLSVLSMELEQSVSWIKWLPEAPFDILPGGAREVTVSIDFSRAPDGESMHRLLVGSTDADENPYPTGVYLVVNKQPCYLLTRSHTGSGSHPVPVPSSSPGCPAGQFHAGTVVQLTAAPATGSSLQSWSGTDNDASTALTNTVTMGAAGRAVAVTYLAHCYALTRTHTGSGTDPEASPASSTGCPAGQYHYAEKIQLTASPTAGWRIGSWTGTDNNSRRGTVNTLTMPAAAASVSVTYLEGLISVLLVNDDSYYNTRLAYTAALELLGEPYDVWEVATSGNPDAETLGSYPAVVWVPYPYDGLSPSQEAVAAAYLDGGGNLFLSAHEYLYYYGLTPFLSNYMGVGSYNDDEGHSQVTGQGIFGGLGPYVISLYGYSFSDQVFPGPGAQVAFLGDGGVSSGVSKVGPGYRTVFLGFPLPGLESQTARKEILDAALDFFITIFEDVPRGHWAKSWVEAIYRAGITSGCATSPLRYCPDNNVNRDQMAVFLLRAKEGAAYTPPPCTTDPFNDVPAASPFCPWIQELANRG
ncbi:MAG: InlB B-repeat-containing protein, partial [Thermoanaerobaculia bacterium]